MSQQPAEKQIMKPSAFCQIGIIVKNIDETIKYYEKMFGFGPYEIKHVDYSDATYYGEKAGYRGKRAFFHLGNIEIELIELVDGKTIHEDWQKEHGEGLHHIGFQVDSLGESVNSAEEAGFAVTASAMAVGGSVFWPPYKPRSMEQLLVDFMINQDIADALLDAVTDRMAVIARRMAEASVDILRLADDLGTQLAPMISLDLFRKFIKPRLAKYVSLIHELSPAKVLFHSCGSLASIIEDLIEIGIDALNPVQVSAAGMNPAELKKKYGGRMVFWGGVDSQRILPKGSVQEVKQAVEQLIETMGPGGGFLLSAVHNIQPDVPLENILAMFEHAREYVPSFAK